MSSDNDLGLKAGDLVEGVASGSTHGSILRRRLDRTPWSGGIGTDGRERTIVSDGRGIHMLDTDTIRVIERAQ